MNEPSSPDRYKQALAMSWGVLDLPRGTVATNPALLASLSSLPRNFELLQKSDINSAFVGKEVQTYRPVPEANTGQTELNRMPFGPYSTAIVLVALITAAFEALYQASPGRGRIPAVEAMLTKEPLIPSFKKYGRMTLVER